MYRALCSTEIMCYTNLFDGEVMISMTSNIRNSAVLSNIDFHIKRMIILCSLYADCHENYTCMLFNNIYSTTYTTRKKKDTRHVSAEKRKCKLKFTTKCKMLLSIRQNSSHFFLNNLTISTSPALTARSRAVMP